MRQSKVPSVCVLMVLGGLGAASQTTPAPPASGRPRVVLLSVDAGADVILDRLLADGTLAGGAFERIQARGLVADSMTPASVASTPISHATIFTGTWPEVHGVVGVAMPGADIGGELRSGFSVQTSVDRIWTIAARAGKRVICIAAPGAEATRPDNTCSETVPFAALSGAATAAVPPSSADDLASRLRRDIGPSPGEPDARAINRGEMSDDDYVSASERFTDYLGKAVQQQLTRDDWDLLLVYMPIVDNVEHRYLVTDPRQAEYGAEAGARRQRFASYVERGFRRVDAVIGRWLDASPRTTFVVVSDHGMIANHSTVLVNNVLATAGLSVAGASAQVRTISSGSTAQIYVNAPPRFPRGVVSTDERATVVERVVAACRTVTDPITKTPVFSFIATHDALDAVGLRHENAGDVYLVAAAGWGVTGRFDAAVPSIVPNTLSPDWRRQVSRSEAEDRFLEAGGNNELSPGVHGHRPGDPRMQAIFLALGPGVPHRRVGTVSMIDVAPTVLSVLGLPAPAQMKGRPVWTP